MTATFSFPFFILFVASGSLSIHPGTVRTVKLEGCGKIFTYFLIYTLVHQKHRYITLFLHTGILQAAIVLDVNDA